MRTTAVLSKVAGAKTLWPEEQLGKRKLKRELEVWASHWCSPRNSGSQAGVCSGEGSALGCEDRILIPEAERHARLSERTPPRERLS